MSFAPIQSSENTYRLPGSHDWYEKRRKVPGEIDETPAKVDLKEYEEKFKEYIANNEEIQKLIEKCKVGTLGVAVILDEKIEELRQEFLKQHPEYAQDGKDINPLKYGSFSQGGLLKYIA